MLGSLAACFAATGQISDSSQNWRNVVMVRDHSENVGFYFYVLIETFLNHLRFFEIGYQLFMPIAVHYIVLLYQRTHTCLKLGLGQEVDQKSKE